MEFRKSLRNAAGNQMDRSNKLIQTHRHRRFRNCRKFACGTMLALMSFAGPSMVSGQQAHQSGPCGPVPCGPQQGPYPHGYQYGYPSQGSQMQYGSPMQYGAPYQQGGAMQQPGMIQYPGPVQSQTPNAATLVPQAAPRPAAPQQPAVPSPAAPSVASPSDANVQQPSDGYVGPLPSAGNWRGPANWEAPYTDGAMIGGSTMGAPIAGGAAGGGYATGVYGPGYSTGVYGGGGTYVSSQACEPVVVAPPAPTGFYGGFEFVWLRASFSRDVAVVIDPPVGNKTLPFEYDYELMPRVFLGWQDPCDGHGFRATYWQFDAESDKICGYATAGQEPVFVSVFGPGDQFFRRATAQAENPLEAGDEDDTLTSTHRLKLQALDLELTQAFNLKRSQFLAGAGLRWAKMDQYMHSIATDNGSGAAESIVAHDLDFEGVGPTASLQMLRPLFNTRLSFYGGLRGSLLVGDKTQRIYNWYEEFIPGDPLATPVVPDSVETIETLDHYTSRDVISQFEMSIGLQYQFPITKQAELILRSAYEAQVWYDLGGPVDMTSTVAFDGISFGIGLLF